MPTEKLYYVNQYQTEAEARVLSCEAAKGGWRVTLDRTVFYPTGGGQPCDLGTLGSAQVLDVSGQGEEIVHLCDAPLPVGETVLCKIDWARRFSLMQQHSGEHIVSGIIHRRFGYDNVGFHMGSDVITIDYSGEITPQELTEIELAANEAIWTNRKTEIFYPDAKTLTALPYRSKKELTGAVRIVRFPDLDTCACCGLHVAMTGEIGLVKLLSVTRFHAGSRIELLCGSRALAYLNAVHGQNREITALLSAKPLQTASAVKRQKEELGAAQYRCGQLENELFARKAAALTDKGDVLLFEAPMQSAAVRRLADAVLAVCGGRCAVFAGEDGSYQYAIGTQRGDLRELCRAMNAALCGRGGGKSGFVQGSISATRSEIESFFAKEKQ